jgi:hypothetical protein
MPTRIALCRAQNSLNKSEHKGNCRKQAVTLPGIGRLFGQGSKSAMAIFRQLSWMAYQRSPHSQLSMRPNGSSGVLSPSKQS